MGGRGGVGSCFRGDVVVFLQGGSGSCFRGNVVVFLQAEEWKLLQGEWYLLPAKNRH